MTARKPAAKRAPAKRTSKPSPAARIDALEREVAELRTMVTNLAQFIATGVAQQIQAQMIGSPDLAAQLQAQLAKQNGG